MQKVVERLIQSYENQSRIVENSEYFDWLYEFTQTYPKFSDTDWLYSGLNKLSPQDVRNINLLEDLFSAIDRYHDRNLLKANTSDYTAWYNIKYKDAYFAIGICVGQGAYNFATRYKSIDDMLPETYIEFEYILEDKPAPGFKEKQGMLEQFEQLVIDMKKLNIPEANLEEIVKKIFDTVNT